MQWYLAKLVFRIICGNGKHTAQFDEQLRLILAVDEGEAYEKAQQIGKMESESFYNMKQQLVQWQFIDAPEINRLSELIDGAEIYSRIQEVDNAEAYTHIIHQKAASRRLEAADVPFHSN